MEFKPLWHYQVIDFGESLGTLERLTQHMRVQSSISGTEIRIKLDNRFNKGAMLISSVFASVLDNDGNVVNTAKLMVDGADSVILAPNETVFTDNAALAVSAGQSVEISVYFESAVGVTALCQTWSPRVWNSWFTSNDDPGRTLDCTDLFPLMAEDIHKPWAVLGVSQVDLLADEDILTIGMFGDSITHMSYYSDALFERLMREYPGRAAIANCGIGGNRLCFDHIFDPDSHGDGRRFGPAGKDRFQQDMYSDMCPDIVLILLGTNDCNLGLAYGYEHELPTVEMYAAAYAGVIGAAHRHGSRVYIGTIPPFNTPDWAAFHDRAETRRLELNTWICSQKLADGVIDFSSAAEDPVKKGVLREDFDVDDRLHPGVTGGKLMASVVPLDKFFFKRD